MASISPILEALLLSIYCVAVMSLSDDECRGLFGSQREGLLGGYQFACRYALLKCRGWRCGDVDGLTAFYLYLVCHYLAVFYAVLIRQVSTRPETDPWSLSSMLAIAIRSAQRMGLHNESTYTRYTNLEAEKCRRLWWSLVMFDHRICEMSDYKTTTLTPI